MNPETNGHPSKLLLSYEEVAALTGLSPRTIWAEVKSGELGSMKLGRRVMIPRAELEKWILQKTHGGDDPGSRVA